MEIIVIGHKNPDTDSICSAIAYANLKRKMTGETYTPKRAGRSEQGNCFCSVLFWVDCPQYLLLSVPVFPDMEIKEVPAWTAKFPSSRHCTLEGKTKPAPCASPIRRVVLEGIITISNIAASDMDIVRQPNRIQSKDSV